MREKTSAGEDANVPSTKCGYAGQVEGAVNAGVELVACSIAARMFSDIAQ